MPQYLRAIAGVLTLAVLSSCVATTRKAVNPSPALPIVETVTPPHSQPEAEPPVHARILAVGDLLARDMKAVGFDVLTNANNHALDYGEYGLIQTGAALDQYLMPHTGTARSPEERDRILVVAVAPTIRMAILGYTYGTNGIPSPHPCSVNLLDPDRIRADILRARGLPGVDLVAVALHMGEEYAREPSPAQEEYVSLSLEAGADIILGDHPHAIQRIEVRRVKDAGRPAWRKSRICRPGSMPINSAASNGTVSLPLSRRSCSGWHAAERG